MNFIETIPNEVLHADTPAHLAVLFFCGLVLSGIYYLDSQQRYKHTEENIVALNKHIKELEDSLQELSQVQEDQAEEQDQRIREKKDYDESDEVESDKYQAWRGYFHDQYMKAEISIWRQKISTIRKNQEWLAWDGKEDASCIVRDFYLGNGQPDFNWTFEETPYSMHGSLEETLVNGWDSVIKFSIQLTLPPRNNLDFVKTEEKDTNKLMNLVLQKFVRNNMIQWSKVLLSV